MSRANPPRLRFDDFELDPGNARLSRAGKAVPVPPKAFAVLCLLAANRGQLVSKGDLLDAVWGHRHVSESVLKSVISQVRAALGDAARAPRYIETVSRFGYRFVADVAGRAQETARAEATAPIVGRATELDRLRAAWRRTLAGERQLVWVVGDAGVGKTTLIDRFVAELAADDVVTGRCVEHFGSREPYLPLLEALNELCRREPELSATLRGAAPTWLLQMPWLIGDGDREALRRELSGTHPDRMVRELRELLIRHTSRKPLLIVTEDLHWCDLGTLRMLEHVARQPGAMRLMWLASFRLTQVIADEHPLKPLRQELLLHRLCQELLLDPFSEAEVDAYLAARLPAVSFPESFVRRLHGHTDGLPLFVASVTDTLAEKAGLSLPEAAAWLDAIADSPMPPNLAGVLENQVARLPRDAASVLEAASVCGTEFRAATVAELLGMDTQRVRAACDDLVRRQLWLQNLPIVDLPDGNFDARYAFPHVLYRQVFYQRMPVSRRIDYHRRIARTIERRREAGESIVAAELASHYERGHAPLAAVRAYADGARIALGRFAPKDAASLAERATALLGSSPAGTERGDLELAVATHAAVATALLHGVGSEQSRQRFEQVRTLCDALPPTPERAFNLNGLGWTYFSRGEYHNALELAERLLAVAIAHGNDSLFVYGCNLKGVTAALQGRLADACAALTNGLERYLAQADGLPLAAYVIDPEVSMRGNFAIPLADRGLIDQARTQVAMALQRANEIRQPIAIMVSNWAAGQVRQKLEDPDAVAAHAAAIADIVDAAMLVHGQGPSLWLRGWAEARQGNPRLGYEHILEGYARHTRLGMYAGCTEVLGDAAEALMLDGDWPGADAQLEQAFELAGRIGERVALPRLWLLKGRIAFAMGRPRDADDALRASLREARRQQSANFELKALVALAEFEPGRAEHLAELDAAYRSCREGLDTPAYRRAGELVRPGA